MKPKATLRSFLALAGSSLLAISHSHAADGTWSVDAGGLWSTDTNWLSNAIADGSGSTANFTNDITADRTVSLDGDRTLTSVVFGDGDTATAGSWILNNNSLSTNNLILAGTTPGITVNALGTGKTATISAIIEGTEGLVKSGTGTLILSGPNTYSGATNINAGTLSTASLAPNASNSGIGSGTDVTLNGGSLRYTGGNSGSDTLSTQFNRSITVGASGGTLDNAGSGFAFYSGTLSGAGALAFLDTSGDANNRQWLVTGNSPGFSGAISIGNGTANSGFVQQRTNAASPLGTGTITLNGGGRLTADNGSTNPSTLSNAIILNGGTLATQTPTMTYSGPITVNASTTSSVGNTGGTGDVSLSGNISGSGTVTTIGGSGWSVQLSGDNSGFTGTWQSTSVQTWFNTAAAGSAAAKWVANGNNFIGNIAGGGTVSLGELSGTAGTLKNDIANTTFTFSVGALNTNSSFSGGITDKNGDATSKTALTKVGTGKQTLSGANTYTGNTTLTAGTLNLGVAEIANVSGPLGKQLANAAGTIILGGGTLQYSASNNNDYSGRFSTAASQAYNVDTNNVAVTWATALTSSSGTLTKIGTGTLTLGGSTSNSYTGTTTLGGNGRILLAKTGGAIAIPGNINISSTAWNGNASGIVLAGDEQIADTSVLTWTTTAFGGGIQQSSFFRLNGHTETIGGLVSTGTGSEAGIENRGFGDTANYATGTLIINTTGSNSYSYNGFIRDKDGGGGTAVIALTKTGTGTQTLTGTNSYTGATTISGGTLALGASNVLPDVSDVTIGSGTLDVDTFDDTVDTLDVTGTAVINLGAGAHIVFAGGGTATWVGTLNITGTFVSGSSLNFGSSSGLSPAQLAAITVNGGGGPFTLDASGYLVAGGASPYDTWASGKGLTGLPGSSTDPAKDADPDNDGSNNLAEFAFNGDPLSGSDNGKVYVLTEDSDFDGDATKELILTCAVRTGTLAFTGSPSPSANQASDNITYSIEGSLDLASFPTTVHVVSPVITGLPVDPGAGYEYRSFSLNGSNGLTGKGFLRAKVTSP